MNQSELSLSRVFTRVPWVLLGLVAAFSVFTLAAGCQKEEKAAGPPPPTVEVVDVVQKDVPIYGEWVGSMDGLVNATIRPQVTGYLIKQNYKEGDFVKKGQVLFEIDPRTFDAALGQAKATLDQARGILDQAKAEVSVQDARWATAKANLARIKPLAEQNAVSQKDLDDAVGMELSTRASVVAAQSSVAAAQANVDKAQLDLGFTKIMSPIDGIAGIAKAQIGNLLSPGSTEELTTVSTVDPIKCYASVSEQEYMQTQEVRTKRVGKVPLELILADGSVWPHKGEFFVADRQVDVRTGTIRVAATFPNPNNILRPGQFARIRAEMEVKKGALVILQRAVTEVQGRYLVAVGGPENKVSIKPVKAGARFGQFWVIDQGLQAGRRWWRRGFRR